MKVVVVDYGSGNLRSVAKALSLAVLDINQEYEVVVSADPDILRYSDYIVLPGVGAFGDCFGGLSKTNGMMESLNDAVMARGVPFLGICVGMQLMAERSIEHGEFPGLGWISGEVVPINPTKNSQKVPHMGWNELMQVTADHPVLSSLTNGDHAYFVHSFAMRCANNNDVLAATEYGGQITAIVGRDNLIGTQFHPEKSQAIGISLLRNFLQWRP